MNQTILVDMDGVLADYSGEFKRRWDCKHPDKPLANWENRQYHDIDKNYPQYTQFINNILMSEDFFHTLQPIPRAIQGLERLAQKHPVVICTAPSLRNKACVPGKYSWIEKNLGYEWVARTIITKDKTLAVGRYLLDDKPEVNGAQIPSWEHLVFTQPYNRHITNKRRVSWDSIDKIIH